MSKNERKDESENELVIKVKKELLSMSDNFNMISKYLEQLKEIINKDEYIYIDDINEQKENNLLLNKKRGIKDKVKEKDKIIEIKNTKEDNGAISLNEKSKSKIKVKSLNKQKNINKSKESQINLSKKSKLTLNNSENEELEEESEEDSDEDEYINSEDENSNSSSEDKNANKHHKRKKKNKIKQNKNGIISKLYPVRTVQNDEISSGYRVYCRCKGISMCFGPYDDFNFAYDLRKLIHSQLKMFTGDIPDVEDKIKEFLKRTKEAVDKKKASIKMVKKNKTINN